MKAGAHAVLQTPADPIRRALSERLSETGEQSVRRLSSFCAISQPALSQRLALLKRAGLVAGRETHCRAEPAGLRPLIGWFAHRDGFWANCRAPARPAPRPSAPAPGAAA